MLVIHTEEVSSRELIVHTQIIPNKERNKQKLETNVSSLFSSLFSVKIFGIPVLNVICQQRYIPRRRDAA